MSSLKRRPDWLEGASDVPALDAAEDAAGVEEEDTGAEEEELSFFLSALRCAFRSAFRCIFRSSLAASFASFSSGVSLSLHIGGEVRGQAGQAGNRGVTLFDVTLL